VYPGIGRRGGSGLNGLFAGLIQPSRTPRSMIDPGSRRGGTISATMRLRSVMTTVSPAAAKRTYSLSLFF
jgi:hypothetical protein